MIFSKKQAYRFIILFGVVSLFADVTYEGARSISGPYLQSLGASAFVVGFIAGFGELVGYGLRFISGYFADKTKRYWLLTITGYVINVLAVPCLALTNYWQAACVLLIAERMGKALRTPARDAMLSHAASSVGHGKAFGIHEALDQIGAVTGPLVVSFILFWRGNYHTAFLALLVPALFSIAVLLVTRYFYPAPHELESASLKIQVKGFNRAFWLYAFSAAFVAAGYADFPLIAFHLQKNHIVEPFWIPVFYSLAMGVDAIAALIFGYFYDRWGMKILAVSTAVSLFFAPLVFSFSSLRIALGMVLWGIGMGAHESVMRAAVSQMTPKEKRATAFGAFNALYGIFWFLGSAALGFFYDHSITMVISVSIGLQLLFFPLFWMTLKAKKVA